MLKHQSPPAPGSRALIRDEEWLIQSADQASQGGYQLRCIGLSETVRNRTALFLTTLDTVKILDPAKTELVADKSPQFTAARLYLEARLRQATPTGTALVQGQHGVMDGLPFQLTPAQQVLGQLRPRLLIADTVGLGKTLEAGIVTAELIRRGKARRILVVTTKSMMRQFQQEFWNRFTIPLTRLDSVGIQRIRREIPANHNPFNYYDRTIISVDTLKRDSEYRHYLEKAWWDLILIDEAHNVSFKGNRTQSNRLATLLAQRSDALILLTATPHNGKKESFASLMRMLDPTVLPANADYTRDDVAHLFVRRFKHDVRDQIRQAFPDRQIFKLTATATAAENRAFAQLAELKLSSDSPSGRSSGAMLFRTTLEKALFSSPAACLQTLRERLRRLEKRDPTHPDLAPLRELEEAVNAITLDQFSKLNHLLQQLAGSGAWQWRGTDPADRLVIFTERIETLKLLQNHLPAALKLKPEQVAILHGQLADTEIQQTVEAFGQTHAPLRLLIASDVASEGLNLHYQSYRLIHFDIPWSLMVFQQRNGRVDRYGQHRAPQIGYLLTLPQQETIRGDLRILEILIDKDEQAAQNIGDPSAFMGLYDEEAEIAAVAAAIEQQTPAAQFAALLADESIDPFELLFGSESTPAAPAPTAAPPTATLPTLYGDDYRYSRDALQWLLGHEPHALHALQQDDGNRTLSFQPGADLALLLERDLATEMWPENNTFTLSGDKGILLNAIERARESNAWPQVHYLWPLHPISQWLDTKLLGLFGRQRAPVVRVSQGVAAGEAVVVLLAQIPNRRGLAVITEWLGVQVDRHGVAQAILTLTQLLEQTGLQRDDLANDGRPLPLEPIQRALPAVIRHAEAYLKPIKQRFDADCRQRLQQELDKLATLRQRHQQQIELDFSAGLGQVIAARKKQRESDNADLFSQYQEWIRQSLELDDRPQWTVVAALVASP